MTNHGKTLPRWSHHTSKEQHIQHLPPRDRSHRSTFAPTYHKPWPLARLQGTSDVWKKGLDEKKTPDPQRWPNSLGLQILFCWDCTTHLLWKIDVYCFESIYIDQLMYWCHIRFSGVNNFDAYPCQNQMSDPRNHRCPGFEGDQQLVEKQQQHVQGTKGPSLWPWLDTFGGAPWFINPMKTSSMCITNKNHRGNWSYVHQLNASSNGDTTLYLYKCIQHQHLTSALHSSARGSDFQFLPELIHLLQGRHDGRFTTDVCELENDLGIAWDVDEKLGDLMKPKIAGTV